MSQPEGTLLPQKTRQGAGSELPSKAGEEAPQSQWENEGSLKVNPVSVLQKNLQKSSVNGLERSDLQAERC